MKNCCIIGLGYIGLPTAALLAKSGYQVTGVDINPKVVADINKGLIHLVEPDLDKLVHQAVKNKSLKATTYPIQSDIFLVAVPTPFKENGKSSNIPIPNIDYVIDAIKSIAKVLKPGNLIIIESTCPIGTTEKIAENIKLITGLSIEEINIAYCPERVIPGKIIKELVNNDRVIGGLNSNASIKAKIFYSSFCTGNLFITNAKTAELVKLTENAFRDVNIAFANELSILCDSLDINVDELISLANHHPRVDILKPGCGVGGHCIAIDPWFISYEAPELTPLIQVARKVNDMKSDWVIEKIMSRISALEKQLNRKPIVGCMGLTFKPNVDDIRESPALKITSSLIDSGQNILVCEPNIKDHTNIRIDSIDTVLDQSDLLVLLVAHHNFLELGLHKYNVIDFCGITS